MKTIAAALAGLMIATTAASAAGDDRTAPKSQCLWAYMIDHTTYVKPNTLLFHMKNGKIYQNALATPCNGLAFHGFVYVVHADTVCGNAQSIRVLETHEVCQLGAFAPYEKPAKAPSSY